MKVLVLGATGNVGLRLVPALLTHNLEVVAYVRSASKLRSVLPSSILSQITIVEGDAMSSSAIKTAILTHDCDALINTAGLAAVMPWSSSTLPAIFAAVVKGARDAQADRKGGAEQPLRCWFLGGMGALDVPGEKAFICSYFPMFREHVHNLALLRTVPTDLLRWSFLCPNMMTPASTDFSVPTKTKRGGLVGGANTPPGWRDSWVKHIPLLGTILLLVLNQSAYVTTLEDNAEFLANDLENGGDVWVGKKVGVINASKMPYRKGDGESWKA